MFVFSWKHQLSEMSWILKMNRPIKLTGKLVFLSSRELAVLILHEVFIQRNSKIDIDRVQELDDLFSLGHFLFMVFNIISEMACILAQKLLTSSTCFSSYSSYSRRVVTNSRPYVRFTRIFIYCNFVIPLFVCVHNTLVIYA